MVNAFSVNILLLLLCEINIKIPVITTLPMNKNMNISPSPPSSYHWTWEFIKGTFRNKFSPLPDRSRREPYSYFNELTQKYYDQYHSASNDDIFCCYLRMIPHINEYLNRKNITVYDLGTGFGDLFNCLQFHTTSNIVLVDFVQDSLAIAESIIADRYNNIIQIKADLNNWGNSSHKSHLTFSINVLPYIGELSSFFGTLSGVTRPSGHCCIVYPIKSPVWEESFDGISIVLHNPQKVNRTAREAGLCLVEEREVRFSLPYSRGKINFPIGIITIFQYVT